MHALLRSLISVSLLSLILLSACGSVQIQDAETCTVAGVLSAGANCSHLVSSDTSEMTMDEFLYFLEAHAATTTTPAQGSAICMSSIDFGNVKTELDTMCRLLGKHCTKAVQAVITQMQSMIDLAQSLPPQH